MRVRIRRFSELWLVQPTGALRADRSSSPAGPSASHRDRPPTTSGVRGPHLSRPATREGPEHLALERWSVPASSVSVAGLSGGGESNCPDLGRFRVCPPA